jgi:predicted DNA-binding transcriptional regulator AlpA
MEPPDRLLGVKELAKKYGICQGVIYDRIKRKVYDKIPKPIFIDGHAYWRAKQIDKHLSGQSDESSEKTDYISLKRVAEIYGISKQAVNYNVRHKIFHKIPEPALMVGCHPFWYEKQIEKHLKEFRERREKETKYRIKDIAKLYKISMANIHTLIYRKMYEIIPEPHCEGKHVFWYSGDVIEHLIGQWTGRKRH